MGKSHIHNGVVNAKATMDLIIVDVLDGLPILIALAPEDVVPPRNQSMESFLEPMFVFEDDYLHDDGAIIVIHPYHVLAKSTILEYCIKYSFQIHKEWLCMNCFFSDHL
jgi:hypothetical protein